MQIELLEGGGGQSNAGGGAVADGVIRVTCTAQVSGRTGVEMEALTGASVTCLTLYDMLKGAAKEAAKAEAAQGSGDASSAPPPGSTAGVGMSIEGLRVLRKSGGRSGDWVNLNADVDEDCGAPSFCRGQTVSSRLCRSPFDLLCKARSNKNKQNTSH